VFLAARGVRVQRERAAVSPPAPVRKEFGSAEHKPLTGMSLASGGPGPQCYGSVWARSSGAVRSWRGKILPGLLPTRAYPGPPSY